MNKKNWIKNLESIGADITKMKNAGLNIVEAIMVLILMESRITSFSLELINAEQKNQLTRIADALESIDKTLSDALPAINGNLADTAEMLEDINRNLSGCISRFGNNSFLCITGNVSKN